MKKKFRLKLARPKKGLPTSLEEVEALICSTPEMMQFFGPETYHAPLKYMSKPAVQLYGIEHIKPGKSLADRMAIQVANRYLPSRTEEYDPRQEFIVQQVRLRMLAQGGVYQLPDLVLVFFDRRGVKVRVDSHSDHLFSPNKEYIGTLITLRATEITEKQYEKYRDARRLVSPTPDEMEAMVEERHNGLSGDEGEAGV